MVRAVWEGHLVDVSLVHLISHQHDLLIMAEFDDVLEVVIRQALPGRIPCTVVTSNDDVSV